MSQPMKQLASAELAKEILEAQGYTRGQCSKCQHFARTIQIGERKLTRSVCSVNAGIDLPVEARASCRLFELAEFLKGKEGDKRK